MRIFLWVAVLLVGILVGCSNNNTAVDENVAQVKVTADGKVFLNGAETTLENLQAEFARLSAADGSVIYYRENPEGEPHPIAEQVIQAVIEAQLPIQFSEQDFG
jgi:biopolymer transport protein ExbD